MTDSSLRAGMITLMVGSAVLENDRELRCALNHSCFRDSFRMAESELV